MTTLTDPISSLVAHYVNNQTKIGTFLKQLTTAFEDSTTLRPYVHSFRSRLKDPAHLRDKLERKRRELPTAGLPWKISDENLFQLINDLAGLRVLHLYTRQFEAINPVIIDLLHEASFRLVEGPCARTWDDESRTYFRGIGIETVESKSLYTSVHYVVEANSKTKYTAEVQVRTLAEELWGEVDHAINYPTPSSSVACQEQIKVLARVTSSCSRLVDSIFRTHSEKPKAN